MPRITLTILVTGIMLVAAVSFGATAFTSATVDRQANIDVVADNNGLLALTDGNSGNLVFQDGNTEQLGIDFTEGTAAGANVNAEFQLGDPAGPTTSNAFQLENRDDEQHQINVAYTGATTNAANNGEENLNVTIYDNSGNAIDSTNEEGAAASFAAPPGNTFYMVLTVDTGNGATTTDLTSASDLSGTISFTIDDVAEGGTNSDGS
jgi:hypothetical protein